MHKYLTSPRNSLFSLLACSGLLVVSSNAFAANIAELDWFQWHATSDNSSIGSLAGQQIGASNTGLNSFIYPGQALNHIDTDIDGSYETELDYLALGDPRGGGTVTTTFDLSNLSTPVSNLIFGVNELDATSGRGSLLISGTNASGQSINVNNWVTEGQYKQVEGVPSAQSLLSRSISGDNMLLGTFQGTDNTAWGDSRWLFLSGISDDTAFITLAHTYANPRSASTKDSIGATFGLAAVPEPEVLFLLTLAGLLRSYTQRVGKKSR
ncbi:MAG: hypothetical protein GQ582_03155 [Methyloprofundus sp.]|nr:hypothetical protein [Methyloprofundus sp.]